MKKKSKGAKLELIGGIFYVEEFSDGTEKRDELDGAAVLQILLQIVTDHADRVIGDAAIQKAAKKVKKPKKKIDPGFDLDDDNG